MNALNELLQNVWRRVPKPRKIREGEYYLYQFSDYAGFAWLDGVAITDDFYWTLETARITQEGLSYQEEWAIQNHKGIWLAQSTGLAEMLKNKRPRLEMGEKYRYGMVDYTPIYWDGFLIAKTRYDRISWYASDNGLSFEDGYGYLYKLMQKWSPRISTIWYDPYTVNDLELMLHAYDVTLLKKKSLELLQTPRGLKNA